MTIRNDHGTEFHQEAPALIDDEGIHHGSQVIPFAAHPYWRDSAVIRMDPSEECRNWFIRMRYSSLPRNTAYHSVYGEIVPQLAADLKRRAEELADRKRSDREQLGLSLEESSRERNKRELRAAFAEIRRIADAADMRKDLRYNLLDACNYIQAHLAR